ncbi:hypothetical protein CgunFtcFv8_010972 [Champsocephalus gunnari]|uniref:Uncharacterized protein n=1 Tax=Champsocephalus gunnari TaxID=52237 RepID=A0AAN8DVB3_CHAGU|nr:hypothetical protein CgunFtcFv8_010972 [Champsocephalus gunnari]
MRMRIAQPAKPSTSHYSPAPTRQFWSDGPTEVKRGDSKQAATISEERAVQFAEWLKNNSQPLAQVEAYMRDSCQYRAGWIRAEHSKSIPEVLAMFPRLTTRGMMPGEK